MSNSNMREILHSFQVNSGLVGPNRSTVLEKCLAASIAYSAPCFAGEVGGDMGFYRTLVQGPAMKLISSVNEICLVRTDQVLADVQRLWLARYHAINNPRVGPSTDAFYTDLKAGDGLTSHYELWVGKFHTAMQAAFTQITGGE
jgi:hypothetical protein